MSQDRINQIVAQWTRLGAMFNSPAAERAPDVEQLLLNTARAAAVSSRLFILAVTWLAKYGDYAAKHRLARLIDDELEHEHRPAMGLMLDLAREKGHANDHRFNRAMNVCASASEARPLFDIDRVTEFFVRRAEQNASALSRKWGLWMEDFALKEDAIRPAQWIVRHNPSIQWRADFKGDLRASILAELQANPDAGASESELARACGATRAATIDALDKLELSARISRVRRRNRLTVRRTGRRAA